MKKNSKQFISFSKIKSNIFLLAIMLIFVFCFGGCDHKPQTEEKGISIVAVSFVQYDFARAICDKDDKITMIMKPGAEIHGFEPSLSDIEAIANADVFIYNGGVSDIWIENIFSSIDTSSMEKVALMNHAMLLEEGHHSHAHHHSHDHSHCDGNHTLGGYDEHIWTSPKNAKLMIEGICAALCKKNPEKSEQYKQNATLYTKEIDTVHQELSHATSGNDNFIAVGDRFPFLYLAKDYSIEYMAAFPGCSHENDASPSVIIDIIETMKEKNINYVFYTESSDQRMADTICQETNAKKLLLHSCQTISQSDFDEGKTYVDFMKNNAKNLKEALS